MPVQAVWGGDHARDRQYPRQPAPKKAGGPAAAGSDPEGATHGAIKALVHGQARLVLDEDAHVVMVELLDEDGQVVQEIPAAELELNEYHGILVDVAT